MIKKLQENETLESLVLDHLYSKSDIQLLCLPGDMLVVNKTIRRLNFGGSGKGFSIVDTKKAIDHRARLAAKQDCVGGFLARLGQ